MHPGVTLREIEGFLLAADALSFSRAAEAMHVTQSAFSQLVRELEAKLGVRLFDRTIRRVALTEAGASLRVGMTRGMREIEDACRVAQSIARVEHGRLVVGTLASLAIGLVTKALGDLRATHPGIKVGLREDNNGALIEQVARGDVDFAVCAHSGTLAGLEFDPLFDDELVVAMRADDPLAHATTLRWKSLAQTPRVMTVRQSSTREQVLDALSRNGIHRDIDYDVGNMFTALSMVREGFGVTFVPDLTIAECSMRGLTARRLRAPTAARSIGICRRPDRSASPAARRFEALLRARVAKAVRARAGVRASG